MGYDPIDVYDEMAKRFNHLENELRSMRAELAEIIRQAVVQNTYQYKPTTPQVVWTNYIPEACRSCSNHPANGGGGNCNCTLGSPSVTCDVTDCSWR